MSNTNRSSFLEALFNGTNAFLGIGILTIPYALSNGGWFSLVLLFVIALLSLYTGVLLKQCLRTNLTLKTYLDIANHAYGRKFKILVSIIIHLELYFIAVGLIILETDSLCKLFPKFKVSRVGGRVSFAIITGLGVLPTLLITNLNILAYVSATGVLACLVILFSILYVGFVDVGFEGKATLWNFGGLPTAISLYVVCYGGHPVLPSIYNSMLQTSQFTKVLTGSILITSLTYAAMASLGNLMYGDGVKSQITMNLPTKQIGSMVAIYTTLLVPVTKYALMVNPIAITVESTLPNRFHNRAWVTILIRVGLLITTIVVACVFPYYESLMAIVGSIFVVLCTFIFPCLCYLKIKYTHWTWNNEVMMIVGIVLVGSLAGAWGTYSSIAHLLRN